MDTYKEKDLTLLNTFIPRLPMGKGLNTGKLVDTKI